MPGGARTSALCGTKCELGLGLCSPRLAGQVFIIYETQQMQRVSHCPARGQDADRGGRERRWGSGAETKEG